MGCIQVLDGGVMVFPAPESARCRAARVGMMLAAVFVGWEDRNAARWPLGKTGRSDGGDQTPQEAHAGRVFVQECSDAAERVQVMLDSETNL